MAFKRGKKKDGFFSTKNIIIVASVVVALVIVFLSLGFLMPNDTIAKNVMAGEINLGGLTLTEAEEKIDKSYPFMGKIIQINSEGKSERIYAEEISLELDAEKTAKKAFEIGKSGNILKNSVDFLKNAFSRIDVGYQAKFDEDVFDEMLYNFGASINGDFTDFQVLIEENVVTVKPRIPGQSKDVSLAKKQILKSIEKGIFSDIEVTMEKASDEPITKDELYEMIYALPKEAEYVLENGEILVKDHVIGVEIDKDALSDAVLSLNQNKDAVISAKTTFPQKTADDLKEKLFNHNLASYSTSYATSTANRAANVELATSKINGKILMPGEEFSYNETIGDTTIANGYKVASVYENGKQTEGVGGGICQVSSTLYSAVLYADLKVTERRNHSLTVAYVPKGQDATVSYGVLDFKFANDTEYPVKISATTSGRTLTISLIGTKPEVDRVVKLTHNVISQTPPTITEIVDPAMQPGTKKVISAGKAGYVVDTIKTVTENGKVVSSEKITKSAYRMLPTEMAVGAPASEVVAPASPLPEEPSVQEPEVTQAPEQSAEPVQKPSQTPFVRPTPAPTE